MEVSEKTRDVCVKMLKSKVKNMDWVLENKADGIKNKEKFDELKTSYEEALFELEDNNDEEQQENDI